MTWKPRFVGDDSGGAGRPHALTVAQMREADRRAIEEFGIPGVVLMENAGRGATDVALTMLEPGHAGVVILCGRGNNGGDGYVIARHLHIMNVAVSVRVLAKLADVKGDARTNLDVLRNMRMDVRELPLPAERKTLARELRGCQLIVDAMLGTGTKGEVRDPFRTAIRLVNAVSVPVLAVDIPSGMNGDTGEPLGACVGAAETATFAAPKIGMLEPDARRYVGTLSIIDIGMPTEIIADAMEGS